MCKIIVVFCIFLYSFSVPFQRLVDDDDDYDDNDDGDDY